MKSLFKIAALLVVTCVATSSYAGEGKGGGFAGKVSAVADGKVTVSNKKKGDQTFKTSGTTKVTKLDGTAGAVSDLKVGAMVKVTPGAAPDQAAEIKMVEKKAPAGGGAGAPSAGGAATPAAAAPVAPDQQ